MPFSNFIPSFVERNPTATFLSLIILASSAVLAVRSQVGNNTILQQWERPLKGGLLSGSGAPVGNVTSSGALNMSGNTLIADQKTGSGRLKIGGTDGGGICWNDPDGTGCTCQSGNNGVVSSYIGTAAECP